MNRNFDYEETSLTTEADVSEERVSLLNQNIKQKPRINESTPAVEQNNETYSKDGKNNVRCFTIFKL